MKFEHVRGLGESFGRAAALRGALPALHQITICRVVALAMLTPKSQIKSGYKNIRCQRHMVQNIHRSLLSSPSSQNVHGTAFCLIKTAAVCCRTPCVAISFSSQSSSQLQGAVHDGKVP